MQGTYW